MNGLTDISMQQDALKVCGRILGLPQISSDALTEVVRVVGMFGTKKQWAPRIEAALARQSKKGRRALQGTMLCFYAMFDDTKNALRYASTRFSLPHDLAFSIEVFADAGRLREVRRLGRRIERMVEKIWGDPRLRDEVRYELNFLLFGLGVFKAHGCLKPAQDEEADLFLNEATREEAVRSWAAVSLENPLGHTAMLRAIDMRVCLMLDQVKHKIQYVKKWNKQCDEHTETNLSLPRNEEVMNKDLMERLNRCRMALEELVPEERRKELGMCRPSQKF